ncbi:MAG: 5-(carboxyamino)imidazole ribonucleotide mutase [Deltaproteobacteria bacterium]|nr:5-(carboxyamino)imidazole ribonucleotide mutase [Deltaproteobacteria bacterium]
MSQPRVAILMGSINDRDVMGRAADVFDRFGIDYEWKVSSAHRTPHATHEYVSTARERGIQVIICGAGLAAHLAGAAAAATTLPIIGVPINGALDGLDSLLATVQMPPGIPVATVAIGSPGSRNAAYLAIQMMALSDDALRQALEDDRAAMRETIHAASAELAEEVARRHANR